MLCWSAFRNDCLEHEKGMATRARQMSRRSQERQGRLGPEAERSVLYPTWSVSPAAYPENELPLYTDNEISKTFISSLCFFKLSSFVPKDPCPFSF